MPYHRLAGGLLLFNGRPARGTTLPPGSVVPSPKIWLHQTLTTSLRIAPELVTRPSRPSRSVWSDLTRCAMHRVLSIVYDGAIYPHLTSPCLDSAGRMAVACIPRGG